MATMDNDEGMSSNGRGWDVRATRESHHCINPVRSCVEEVFDEALKQRNPDKELIKLSIGMLLGTHIY